MNGETVELAGTVCAMAKREFVQKFPGVRGLKYDGYSFIVMPAAGAPAFPVSSYLPATRRVHYKCNPSRHVCNARCMGGKCGGTCECQCGGRNHGIYNA